MWIRLLMPSPGVRAQSKSLTALGSIFLIYLMEIILVLPTTQEYCENLVQKMLTGNTSKFLIKTLPTGLLPCIFLYP